MAAANRPEQYGVRSAACPRCGGTKLSSHGGNSQDYYYRCKKCDPTKSGPTFKAPKPPPSYKKD
jgi:tRNA(Ile2) C34 agmatinyltransferase TiaS